MKTRAIVTAIVLTASCAMLYADSPLTSTYFANLYPEYPIIQNTSNNPVFTDDVAAFLLDKKNPIDAKAALVNAMGWSYEGTTNSDKFKEYLATKYKTTTAGLQLSSLSADELLCLGYFMALDNYFVVDDAINVLEMAKNKKSESFTINLILAIAKAQKAMDSNYCDVWRYTSEVLNNKSLSRDMKRDSIQSIVDYTILYKADCYW